MQASCTFTIDSIQHSYNYKRNYEPWLVGLNVRLCGLLRTETGRWEYTLICEAELIFEIQCVGGVSVCLYVKLNFW